MALTADAVRQAAKQWVMKAYKNTRKTANLDTDQIKAGLASIDSWVDVNQGSFVSALPQPFKSNTTAQEKTLGLVYVVMKRSGLV